MKKSIFIFLVVFSLFGGIFYALYSAAPLVIFGILTGSHQRHVSNTHAFRVIEEYYKSISQTKFGCYTDPQDDFNEFHFIKKQTIARTVETLKIDPRLYKKWRLENRQLFREKSAVAAARYCEDE